ncbi:hypothetical protein AB4Z48_17720 [Cupriavidus sp. 2TAF22]|uniref:head-tail connector protein n=1 Tax=unclassified Cupriavidus TaxID=2640874 RepID=UPI003F8DC6B1
MRYETVTEPADEPVSLAQAMEQARIDGIDADPNLQARLAGVRRATETYLRRPLRAQQYRALLDDDEQLGEILVRGYGPATVTSVSYLDASGARQTVPLLAYRTEEVARGLLVRPVKAWPAGSGFQIEFDVGFATVPEDICLAILMLFAELYAKREVSATTLSESDFNMYDWLLADYRCGIGL